MIKNIVLSACGPNIVTMIGTLHELHKHNFWNLDDIENFYGSSGGAVISVLLLLSDDFNMLKEYIIKRPWNTVWPLEPNNVLSMFTKMGIFNMDDFYKALEPFFNAKNIDKNITLKEFYNLTKKTIYFYIAELNKFEVFNVSHKTNPNMKLLEAMYKSSSVPGIFVPILEDDKCFIDGGLLNYFPMDDALNNSENNSILGLCNKRVNKHSIITYKSNIIDFFTALLIKNMDYVINSVFQTNKLNNILYIPGFDSNKLWLQIINEETKRIEMYNLGIETAKTFMKEKLKT